MIMSKQNPSGKIHVTSFRRSGRVYSKEAKLRWMSVFQMCS